jgi:hypothetical protein
MAPVLIRALCEEVIATGAVHDGSQEPSEHDPARALDLIYPAISPTNCALRAERWRVSARFGFIVFWISVEVGGAPPSNY